MVTSPRSWRIGCLHQSRRPRLHLLPPHHHIHSSGGSMKSKFLRSKPTMRFAHAVTATRPHDVSNIKLGISPNYSVENTRTCLSELKNRHTLRMHRTSVHKSLTALNFLVTSTRSSWTTSSPKATLKPLKDLLQRQTSVLELISIQSTNE